KPRLRRLSRFRPSVRRAGTLRSTRAELVRGAASEGPDRRMSTCYGRAPPRPRGPARRPRPGGSRTAGSLRAGTRPDGLRARSGALVLERDAERDAVGAPLPVLDRDVEPGRLCDTQVAHALGRGLDGVL